MITENKRLSHQIEVLESQVGTPAQTAKECECERLYFANANLEVHVKTLQADLSEVTPRKQAKQCPHRRCCVSVNMVTHSLHCRWPCTRRKVRC